MAATRIITNAWKARTLPDIFYEDPEPVEDGMQQAPVIFRIVQLLTQRYEGRPDVFVSGGGFVAYDRTDGNQRVAPDCYIAFDVDVAGIYANLPNFWIWETGKAPDFVMEVASPSTAQNDLGRKRELYERLGIQEYWRFDPTGGQLYGQALAGERLVDGKYEPCDAEVGDDGSIRGYSELMEVVFYWDGVSSFDVLDPETGRTIDQREAAENRAAAALARADQEQARADAAEAHIRELEAQLNRPEQ